tara:strand:- start:734 stop:1531 length:798 start_codon:yes stop_codon:yes gene_type:complete
MLKISREQMTKMSAGILITFKTQLKEHIRSYFPVQSEHLDDANLLVFIDEAIETANYFAISEQAAIQSFIDHTVLLGRNFHQNPLYAELCLPLYDKDISDNIHRLDTLYDNTWAYLDIVRGKDASHLFLAVSRLKSWLESAKALGYNSLNIHEIINAFNLVFPEKYKAHSEKVHIDFIREAVSRAIEDNFLQPASQLSYVLMAFIAGLNFYHDQLIIGALKKDTQALSVEHDQSARYEMLLNAANNYLSKIITSARALATEQKKD